MKFKIYVQDSSELTDQYFIMKEYRNDILLKVDSLYYALSFMTPDLIKQETSCEDFYYIKNLFPIQEVSLKEIIKTITKNVNLGYYEDLKPETNVDIKTWIKIFEI